jgi:dolichyl-phosphate-mannose-protein mannosyltransferase
MIFKVKQSSRVCYCVTDPILLFFISGACYAMVHFRTLANQPFSNQWWIWLSLTGFMLAGRYQKN